MTCNHDVVPAQAGVLVCTIPIYQRRDWKFIAKIIPRRAASTGSAGTTRLRAFRTLSLLTGVLRLPDKDWLVGYGKSKKVAHKPSGAVLRALSLHGSADTCADCFRKSG